MRAISLEEQLGHVWAATTPGTRSPPDSNSADGLPGRWVNTVLTLADVLEIAHWILVQCFEHGATNTSPGEGVLTCLDRAFMRGSSLMVDQRYGSMHRGAPVAKGDGGAHRGRQPEAGVSTHFDPGPSRKRRLRDVPGRVPRANCYDIPVALMSVFVRPHGKHRAGPTANSDSWPSTTTAAAARLATVLSHPRHYPPRSSASAGPRVDRSSRERAPVAVVQSLRRDTSHHQRLAAH